MYEDRDTIARLRERIPSFECVEGCHVMAQLGKDCFEGEGWEAFDRGEKTPPTV